MKMMRGGSTTYYTPPPPPHQQHRTRNRVVVASDSGISPLAEAILRGCVECIRFLVEAPPHYSVHEPCGPDGLLPVHIASSQGHLHVLRYLTSCGASLDKGDRNGGTGLHWAALKGQLRAVRWLLRHGAPPFCRDKWGRYPIDIGAEHGHSHVVTLLATHSSSSSSCTSYGGDNETTNPVTPDTDNGQLKSSSDLVSSSGNSSLTTTATPSGSPSPNLPVSPSCDCPPTTSTIGSLVSKITTRSGDFSNVPFYLHPPPNSTEFPHFQQVSVTVEPFYLHPPNSEIDYPLNPGLSGPSVHFHLPIGEEEETLMAPVAPLITSDCQDHNSDEEHSTPPPKTNVKRIGPSENPVPLPPPLPPPMPKFNSTNQFRLPLISNDPPQFENDYEDIEDIQGEDGDYEEPTCQPKLSRSVSAPIPPPLPMSPTDPGKPTGLIQPKGLLTNSRRPFIPPNFPDPPHDALIKPSEYLKSIQIGHNSKLKLTGTKSVGSGSDSGRASRKIEETIKKLNGLEMSIVPEETNPDDDFDECNFEPNQTEIYKPSGYLGHNLRKTLMSRTLSAPVLGRVIPDPPVGRVLPDPPSTIQEIPRPPPPLPPIRSQPQPTSSKAAIIAELTESSQVGGLREWKEELRRRQLEEEKALNKEIASIYSPLNFVSGVPEIDDTGTPIPSWKRQMLAKKVAERAKKEAEEQRRLDAEAKKASSIPPWKRQLIQRRDSDGKSAQ